MLTISFAIALKIMSSEGRVRGDVGILLILTLMFDAILFLGILVVIGLFVQG
jgi:Kef-type K+ transport system membrane component KefB